MNRFWLITVLLFSSISFGSEIADLDFRQEKLTKMFLDIRATHDPTNIIKALDQGNKKLVNAYLNSLKIFFKEYDRFNNDKIDYFLKRTYQKQIALHNNGSKKIFSMKLNKLMNEIHYLYKTYNERKSFFGTERDYLRVEAGSSFNNSVGKYSNFLKKKLKKNKTRDFGFKILPFVDSLKDFYSVSDEFLNLIWSSYTKTKNNKTDEIPIIDALKKISVQIASDHNVESRWEGLQNLKNLKHDGKSAELYAFMHGNSFFDTMTQIDFPVDGLSVVGNVDVIFPKFIANQMHKSDHMITVGKYDVVPKFSKLVKDKKLNKFQVAPEGFTPVGFQEIRPCVDIFAKVIYDIIDKGIELSIFPVSFPNNLKLLNQWRNPIEKNNESVGVLYEGISYKQMLNLKKYTKDIQSIAHLVRWYWFSDLENATGEPLAMIKPSRMKTQLDFLLWENIDENLFESN